MRRFLLRHTTQSAEWLLLCATEVCGSLTHHPSEGATERFDGLVPHSRADLSEGEVLVLQQHRGQVHPRADTRNLLVEVEGELASLERPSARRATPISVWTT